MRDTVSEWLLEIIMQDTEAGLTLVFHNQAVSSRPDNESNEYLTPLEKAGDNPWYADGYPYPLLSGLSALRKGSQKSSPLAALLKEVMTSITTLLYPYVSYPVLVFNLKGLDAAVECGVEEVALYVLPGSHSEKRISSTAWMRDWPMLNFPTVAGINVRGYRSCVMGCRYKDSTDPNKVVMVAKIMLGMGSHEMSLGDTIGVGHTWPLALSERCWRMWRRWCRCSR